MMAFHPVTKGLYRTAEMGVATSVYAVVIMCPRIAAYDAVAWRPDVAAAARQVRTELSARVRAAIMTFGDDGASR
jgi:hypothetical protein